MTAARPAVQSQITATSQLGIPVSTRGAETIGREFGRHTFFTAGNQGPTGSRMLDTFERAANRRGEIAAVQT